MMSPEDGPSASYDLDEQRDAIERSVNWIMDVMSYKNVQIMAHERKLPRNFKKLEMARLIALHNAGAGNELKALLAELRESRTRARRSSQLPYETSAGYTTTAEADSANLDFDDDDDDLLFSPSVDDDGDEDYEPSKPKRARPSSAMGKPDRRPSHEMMSPGLSAGVDVGGQGQGQAMPSGCSPLGCRSAPPVVGACDSPRASPGAVSGSAMSGAGKQDAVKVQTALQRPSFNGSKNKVSRNGRALKPKTKDGSYVYPTVATQSNALSYNLMPIASPGYCQAPGLEGNSFEHPQLAASRYRPQPSYGMVGNSVGSCGSSKPWSSNRPFLSGPNFGYQSEPLNRDHEQVGHAKHYSGQHHQQASSASMPYSHPHSAFERTLHTGANYDGQVSYKQPNAQMHSPLPPPLVRPIPIVPQHTNMDGFSTEAVNGSLEWFLNVKSDLLHMPEQLSPYWKTANTNSVNSYTTPIFSYNSTSQYVNSPTFSSPIPSNSGYAAFPPGVNSNSVRPRHYTFDNQQEPNSYGMHRTGYGVGPTQYTQDTRHSSKPSPKVESHLEAFSQSTPLYQEQNQRLANSSLSKLGSSVMGPSPPAVFDNHPNSHGWQQDHKRKQWSQNGEDPSNHQQFFAPKHQRQIIPKVHQRQTSLPVPRKRQVLHETVPSAMQQLQTNIQGQRTRPTVHYPNALHQQQHSQTMKQEQNNFYSTNMNNRDPVKSQMVSSFQPQQPVVHHRQDVDSRKPSQQSVQVTSRKESSPQRMDGQHPGSRVSLLKRSWANFQPRPDQPELPFSEFRGQNNQLSLPLIYDYLTSAEKQVSHFQSDQHGHSQVLSSPNPAMTSVVGSEHDIVDIDNSIPVSSSIIEDDILPSIVGQALNSRMQDLSKFDEAMEMMSPESVESSNLSPSGPVTSSVETAHSTTDDQVGSSADQETGSPAVQDRLTPVVPTKCVEDNESQQSTDPDIDLIPKLSSRDHNAVDTVVNTLPSQAEFLEETLNLDDNMVSICVPSQADTTLKIVEKEDENANRVVFLCSDEAGTHEYMTLSVSQDSTLNRTASLSETVSLTPSISDTTCSGTSSELTVSRSNELQNTSSHISQISTVAVTSSDVSTESASGISDYLSSRTADDVSMESADLTTRRGACSDQENLGFQSSITPEETGTEDEARSNNSCEVRESLNSENTISSERREESLLVQNTTLSLGNSLRTRTQHQPAELFSGEDILVPSCSGAVQVTSDLVCGTHIPDDSTEINELSDSVPDCSLKLEQLSDVKKNLRDVPSASQNSVGDESTEIQHEEEAIDTCQKINIVNEKIEPESGFINDCEPDMEVPYVTTTDEIPEEPRGDVIELGNNPMNLSIEEVDIERSKECDMLKSPKNNFLTMQPMTVHDNDHLTLVNHQSTAYKENSYDNSSGFNVSVSKPLSLDCSVVLEPFSITESGSDCNLNPSRCKDIVTRDCPQNGRGSLDETRAQEKDLGDTYFSENELNDLSTTEGYEVGMTPTLRSKTVGKTYPGKSLGRCTRQSLRSSSNHTDGTLPMRRRSAPLRMDSAMYQKAKGSKPCPNMSHGCPLILPPAQLTSHHLVCEYTVVQCPVVSCVWENIAKKLCSHIREAHRREIGVGPGDFMHTVSVEQINQKSYLSFLKEVSRKLFVIRVHSHQKNIYATMQYIASGRTERPITATGTIEVVDSSGCPYAWRGKVVPIQQKLESIRESGSCLQISSESLASAPEVLAVTFHGNIKVNLSQSQSFAGSTTENNSRENVA